MARRPAELGSLAPLPWTGGQLTAVERRSLLRRLAAVHAGNVAGRFAMLLRVNSGRRGEWTLVRRAAPDSALTRAALVVAGQRLTPALLRHSHRAYRFGAALAEVDGLDVDREVLLAAALLHDVGLPTGEPHVDFACSSARAARAVAEDVGLSTAATAALCDAVRLAHTPGVPLAQGPAAHLLSAGAALDVFGVGAARLPPGLLADVVSAHPRLGFKREFSAAIRAEATRVPRGRAAFLRRYGAFDLAVRTAPFRS